MVAFACFANEHGAARPAGTLMHLLQRMHDVASTSYHLECLAGPVCLAPAALQALASGWHSTDQ